MFIIKRIQKILPERSSALEVRTGRQLALVALTIMFGIQVEGGSGSMLNKSGPGSYICGEFYSTGLSVCHIFDTSLSLKHHSINENWLIYTYKAFSVHLYCDRHLCFKVSLVSIMFTCASVSGFLSFSLYLSQFCFPIVCIMYVHCSVIGYT